ncbi:segregation/condensation protein A [Vagococcus sp. BWB3-3]|uniref:Segregation and condensation protein A n=1 Tax=Vagococcus allomyrinae TaxID=2794353 RepID=A0A940PAU1_9ENTE|nr:segregation/condensation protein A [Vagococcus allomyrinae]MBP1040623.1 segregation/condensation protein A [Vagococcus allomyrinae]
MTELNVKLAVFEGPLDLLLHLIKTLEIDIYDIPISQITSQYMGYIKTMSTLQLDVAGEYIVMAATLMAIKSKMLLPKQELELDEDENEEGDDPRAALVAQLLEYRKFKYAATILKEKEEDRGNYFTKEPSNLDEYKDDIPPLDPNEINQIDLFLAFHDILQRRKSDGPKETTITHDHNTIEQKIAFISGLMKNLPLTQGVPFESLFVTFSKSEIVTTFMALLELVKSRQIVARQPENYDPIYLYNREIEEELEQDEE